MLVKSLVSTLLLSSVVSCAVIVQRDNKDVLDKIATIKTDLGTLETSIKAFDGSITTGYPIYSGAYQVDSDLYQAIDAVNAVSDKWAGDDSTGVVAAVTDLAAEVTKCLDGLTEKIPLLKQLGQVIVNGVIQELQNLESGSDQLYEALEAKVADSDNAAVTKTGGEVHDAFEKLIAKIPASN